MSAVSAITVVVRYGRSLAKDDADSVEQPYREIGHKIPRQSAKTEQALRIEYTKSATCARFSRYHGPFHLL